MPQPLMSEKLKLMSSMKTYKISRMTPKEDVLFIIGDWNAKIGSMRYLEEQASLALEYKMKQGKG